MMRTLRERHEQGFARSPMDFIDGPGDAVIVVIRPREVAGEEWPEEAAATIRFRERKVIQMRDFRSARTRSPRSASSRHPISRPVESDTVPEQVSAS
jgi:hypothetical protein